MAGVAAGRLWRQLPCAFSLLLLAIIKLQLQMVMVCLADSSAWYDLITPVCSNATFTETSRWGGTAPYATNLSLMRANFTASASSTLYGLLSLGSAPDAVYGTYQCRGDLNSSQCSACISNAVYVSSSRCPDSINVRIELDACTLLYQNFSIAPDFSVISNVHGSIINDSAVFSSARLLLVQNVSSAAPSSPIFYSSTSNDSIYAVAQCHGYLTSDQCRQCLSDAPNSMDSFLEDYTGGRIFYGSCTYRYETYIFFNSAPSARDGFFFNSTEGPLHQSKQRLLIWLIVGCVVGLVVCCAAWVYWKWAIKTTARKEGDTDVCKLVQENLVRLFTAQEIMEATDNFAERHKLGEGGYGSVYKGILPSSGQEVAIKKLKYLKSSEEQDSFLNELKPIIKVQHRNLIRLLGYYVEGPEKCLVYEYFPNQSLDKYIFGCEAERASLLPWNTRHRIILGVAKGLVYLHEGLNVHIIHRDIKAANILLDEKLEPKIADFGIAKIFSDDKSYVFTDIRGTRGYIAPDVLQHAEITDKSDTYSFGILLLEILSGRRVIDEKFPPDQKFLLKWAWELYEKGRPLDLMDPLLRGNYRQDEARRAVQVSLLCTQMTAAERPTMATVVAWLEGRAEMVDFPRNPGFVSPMSSGIPSFSGSSESQPTTSSTSHSAGVPHHFFTEQRLPHLSSDRLHRSAFRMQSL